ncbi:MAG: nicotinamide mononucleotide transporter [Bacteroidales bacterium]|nr:nicotinamide mononucleotide transporter [Bacteroidales bacterium]
MDWIAQNLIELTASLLGIAYVILALKQKALCWPVGIVNVGMYIFVFYQARLFGDMALQAFYLVMGFYGWYNWVHGKASGEKKLPVIRMAGKTVVILALIIVTAAVVFGVVLRATSSSLPFWDGATTALGLAATWMTARKYLENWLLWIFTDLLCTGIYIYKELYLTSALYLVLAMVAAVAWFEWKKNLQHDS